MSDAEKRLWELRQLVLETTKCDSITEAMTKYRQMEKRLQELEHDHRSDD